MEITINNKKTEMVLDLGALRIAKKETGVNILNVKGEDFNDPDVIVAIIYGCANRGNKKITMQDVETIKPSELEEIMKSLEELFKDFAPEAAGEGPLAGKPQA